jgi:hypothetical protein
VPIFSVLPTWVVWNKTCTTYGVLRITVITSDKVLLVLEGRLVGPWVDELRMIASRNKGCSKPMEIDVSEVTFADEDGEKALSSLHTMGAVFRGKGACYATYLFARLKIPLHCRRTLSRRGRRMS